MNPTLIERLPRLIATGRRETQRLLLSSRGRNRELAQLRERIAPSGNTPDTTVRRLLCGEPALALAALVAGRNAATPATSNIATVCIALPVTATQRAVEAALARWIPCLLLLPSLAPDARVHLCLPRDADPLLRLVFDALAPEQARWHDAAIDVDAVAVPAGCALLLADDAPALAALVATTATRAWIACAPDAASTARVRRGLLARDAGFSVEDVGMAPVSWARRHVGTRGAQTAMAAALHAFGAERIDGPQPSPAEHARRHAGRDVLLGERQCDGVRTLVWVDPPDRRTGESTLCRAITRREQGAWGHVVVLGWHFAPTIGQSLAMRCDSRIEVRSIRSLPRAGGGTARVDPNGFLPADGPAVAWCERRRSRDTPDAEWLTVEWPREGGTPGDWSIDPDHTDDGFRGTWHSVRDGGGVPVRSVRLRLPWRAGARRVCVRTVDEHGRVFDIVQLVRHALASSPGTRSRVDRPPAPPQRESLC